MPEFKFSCPNCNQHILCDAGYSGMRISCPACRQIITVPSAPLPKKKSGALKMALGITVVLVCAATGFFGVQFALHHVGKLKGNPTARVVKPTAAETAQPLSNLANVHSADTNLTSVKATGTVTLVDTLNVAPVWAGHPVGFALFTHPPYQFVGFYDEHRRLTVAQRRLDQRKWRFTKLPDTTGWDSHNFIALTADDDGFLHMCADMHAVPLKYFRTTKPWNAATFERIDKMTGRNESRCTYPQFLRGPKNELLFTYRDGYSGNGNQIYDCYDLKTKTWRRFLNAPLTDGEGRNNAYFDGPVRGPNGWYHLAWVWRATGNAATCHDLSYARSRDLKHWETSAGKPLPLPIKLSNCEIVDPVPQHGGIINNNIKIGFDAAGRVCISYHKNDAQGNTQPFIARLENGRWVLHQVADWPVRWNFGGGGALPFKIRIGRVFVGKDGRLLENFRHFKFGSGTWVLDPTTLRAVGLVKYQRASSALETLYKVEGSFPGLQVRWAGDSGSSGQPGLKYELRWETLGVHRDRPRKGPLPPPSMLQLVTIKTSN